MNKKTLTKLLEEKSFYGMSWIKYIKQWEYSLSAINSFLVANNINLKLFEEMDDNETYVIAKTWLNLAPAICGWFEFDSECDIDNPTDAEDFKQKLLDLIEEVEYIKEQQIK